eukprot:9013729-Lingulodinium_polyedra.AAC.1
MRQPLAKSCAAASSTMQRSNLLIDLAMVRMKRLSYEQLVSRPRVFYGWADSSPQLGRDWLVLRYFSISSDELIACWEAQLDLARDRPWREAAVRREKAAREARALHGFEPDGMLNEAIADEVDMSSDSSSSTEASCEEALLLARREELCRLLKDQLLPHVCVPASMGQGCTDVASKVLAATHQLAVESPDVRVLQEMLKSFVSMTTDMGVELSMAEFDLQQLDDVLPIWVKAGPMYDDSREEQDLEPARLQPQTTWMPEGLTVAGLLHVIHNMSKDMDV